MVTPKKIIIKDLELADEEITRLRKENKELKALKAQIAEYDDLTEELDYRKREAKRLWWNNMNNKQEIHF